MVRYVDHRTAVIWLELRRFMEFELRVAPIIRGQVGPYHTVRAWPVRVFDAYFAWVPLEFLNPDTWYTYQIVAGDPDPLQPRACLWPDARLTGTNLGSTFRTLPWWSVDRCKIATGSCRSGYPPGDGRITADHVGEDALRALAEDLRRDWPLRDEAWPQLLLLTGDQIYADYLSEALQTKYDDEIRDDYDGKAHAWTWRMFADVYREAWTATPIVRWLLSCIPTFMTCDDHDVVDDWNITQWWVDDRMDKANWKRKVRHGLLAYWIYQAAGNLPPSEWSRDERMQPLARRIGSTVGDATDSLSRLFTAYVAKERRANWSFAMDVPGMRVVAADTRMSRKLSAGGFPPDRRLLMDAEAWSRFVELVKTAPQRRILMITPGPFMTPKLIHELQSMVARLIEEGLTVAEQVEAAIIGGLAGGVLLGPLGSLAGFGAGLFGAEEALEEVLPGAVEELDVELWPAFPTSFDLMLGLLEDLDEGVGTSEKHFVAILSGDVHFSYTMVGKLLRTPKQRLVWQLTCSSMRRQMDADEWAKIKSLCAGDIPGVWDWVFDLATDFPDFVNEQRRRLLWTPVANNEPADPENPDGWAFNRTFVGWLDTTPFQIDWRLDRADPGSVLKEQDSEKLWPVA